MNTSNRTYIFWLFVCISAISCIKEPSCENYIKITESNEIEAIRQCQGQANRYPEMHVISTKELGCLTKREAQNARLTESEGEHTSVICSGVIATVRIRIVKK